MNKYVVTVEYLNSFANGDTTKYRVNTELSKEEVQKIITEDEQANYTDFKVEVSVETLEEYLSDIDLIEL